MKDLTERIKYLAGKNPAQFARDAKISDQTFRKYLKGSMPGPGKILKIAEAGNVSTDWLLTGHEPRPNTPSNGYTPREIQLLENSEAANKKLNERLEKEIKELNQKVKELEREVQMLKKTWLSGRRLGDPPELAVAALRKQSKKEK